MKVGGYALLVTCLVSLSGCSGGSTSSSCGVASPWVQVVNGGRHSVEVSAWRGETPVLVSSDSTQTIFPASGYAAPPWRLLVKDRATGQVVLDRVIGTTEGPIKVTITPSSIVVGPPDPPKKGEC